MSRTIAYSCPNCGAGLAFNAEKQNFFCEFCLSSFTEQELLDRLSKEREAEENAANEEYREEMREYECPNCGAHVVSDDSTAAEECPYCHNPIVLVGRLSGEMKPQKIIPFKFDKKEAEHRFFTTVSKKIFLPRDFLRKEQVGKITGVYYPFWSTDADAGASLHAKATRLRIWRIKNVEYTETSTFSIERAGDIHFEDITTSALTEENKRMLEGVLPYPSEAMQTFSMPYLSGFVAKKRDLSKDDVQPEVQLRMEKYSKELLSGTIRGYNTVSVDHHELDLKRINWDYTFLPIWILTYRGRKNKVYTYAMNGYTGKLYGSFPVSLWKLGLLCVGIVTACSFLIAALGGRFF